MFIVHIKKHLIPDFIINKNELKKKKASWAIMKPETKPPGTQEKNLSRLESGKDFSDSAMKAPHTEENITNLFCIKI